MTRTKMIAGALVGVGVALLSMWMVAGSALPPVWAVGLLGFPVLVVGLVWMLAEYVRDRRRLLWNRLRQIRRLDVGEAEERAKP